MYLIFNSGALWFVYGLLLGAVPSSCEGLTLGSRGLAGDEA